MTALIATPRVGIIGLGGIGRTHIAAWQANGITPVAFSDTVPALLDAAIAAHGGTPYASAIDLLQSGSVDIVSICTPPAFHADLAIAALEAGVATICEKPLAANLADALRVQDAATQTGTLITVGFCHRFQPHIEELKRRIEAGELGQIRTFRNRFAGLMASAETTWFANPAISGGGALIDTSVHSIDLFRYLVGDPVTVDAVMSTTETSLGPALQVEDTAILILKTADGALGSIEASWRTPVGEWKITLYGTSGTAVVDYSTNELRICSVAVGGEWATIDVPEGDRFQREIADLIDRWQSGGTPRATVADGVAANRILDAAYRSASSVGTPV
ncbi:MAG: Gfo/Idh/MocA family oxidoreductase [Thermomicrobiales bacterium]